VEKGQEFHLTERKLMRDYAAFMEADQSPEARTALRQGHRLRKARLLLAEGDRQWTATLDAPTMTLSGVKLPDDAEECDSDADRTADRAANWLALHEIVQSLYGAFLKERLQEDYRTTGAESQAAWMAR